MRITCVAPAPLQSAANHLAMVFGYSAADGLTYQSLDWQDDQGNLYAAASFLVPDGWVAKAQSSLVRPDWDLDQIIDMGAASKAQSALVFWSTDDAAPLPQPSMNTLTAIGGMDGLAAVKAMGLTAFRGHG